MLVSLAPYLEPHQNPAFSLLGATARKKRGVGYQKASKYGGVCTLKILKCDYKETDFLCFAFLFPSLLFQY
jgi:hypothetical protein